MKARLFRGPFNGKVIETDGRTEILYAGPKPMSKRKRWERAAELYKEGTPPYYYNGNGIDHIIDQENHVRSVYRMAMRTNIGPGGMVQRSFCYHPDGSIYYEWVKNI